MDDIRKECQHTLAYNEMKKGSSVINYRRTLFHFVNYPLNESPTKLQNI
jgi:hypothetical protein